MGVRVWVWVCAGRPPLPVGLDTADGICTSVPRGIRPLSCTGIVSLAGRLRNGYFNFVGTSRKRGQTRREKESWEVREGGTQREKGM